MIVTEQMDGPPKVKVNKPITIALPSSERCPMRHCIALDTLRHEYESPCNFIGIHICQSAYWLTLI